jgi:hypothetical protein
MSTLDRRRFLKEVLGTLVQAAGTVVVATVAASTARAQGPEVPTTEMGGNDVQGRADRLAATGGCAPEDAEEPGVFLNRGWRNSPVGGWQNLPGGFRNTPTSSWRNAPLGTFRNTPVGPFGNGGWPNGGWGGGFQNGGWPNAGWRNWW